MSRRVHGIRLLVIAVLVTALAGTVSADVFNMPTDQTSLETVRVGNPGNAADTRYATPGYGSVGYTYNIGKYEVTAGQYTEFLNKVAARDTFGLYNPNMADPTASSDWTGGYGCNIQRSGVPGSYTYSVASDWANRPVNYVGFWDACRFVNWLHNGQPTGEQGAGTTERGAYTLDGYNGADGRAIQRNADWKWAVTSEDEWYKAAYHKNDGITSNYFDYATSSDSVPSNILGNPADPGNNATFWNYQDDSFTIGDPYYRTEVGAHETSDSPYGTCDQDGNLWEWNESLTSGSLRGERGAGFTSHIDSLNASFRYFYNPMSEDRDQGFRVVEVPEPATILMLGLAGMGILRRKPHS